MSRRPLRILLLNQYFPPDTSATARVALDAVSALRHAGHAVTVIAGRPSYDPTERQAWRPLHRSRARGVTVERVGSFAFSRARMAGRVANYVSYLALALWRGLARRADLVLAMTDPPVVSVVAALVAALRRVPFVYNVRDLHPEMAVAAGLVRRGLAVALWERLHRWSLRRADGVIVLGEDMRRRVVSAGVPPERVRVIRDGAAFPSSIPAREHAVSRQIACGFSFVILHAGNLGFAGAWETILEAARSVDGGAGFVFVGDGAAAGAVRAQAAALPNVRFLPYRPAEEVPHVLQAGDLHIVTVRRGLDGLVVPSKLYPILAAGRPVLAVAPEESDAAEIVRRTKCGWVAAPDDPAAVVRALYEAMSDRGELERRGRRARHAAREFERSRELRRMVRTLEASARCPSYDRVARGG